MEVLVVCTGNVCRSPIAAQLLGARLARLGIEADVTSAGTRALVGSPMTPEAIDVLAGFGVEPAGHAARQLTEGLVRGSELILTATRAHRAEVASMVPAAARRAYTLHEFARVASVVSLDRPDADATDPTGLLRSLVAAAPTQRGFAAPPANPDDDDVVDPYRRPPEVYVEAGERIDLAVAALTEALLAPIGPGGRGGA
ncbi:arsenate reductase/protein-tyrosine-phosphatase family protein [Agromyces agglutinans]|uniref:arsenate reductase/protein-tyrosine-phosphatase family protein n=1 Tax=Agromyces agglutinans TaxID=2662258 RepID=UPI001299D6FD|nr:low molecular weight phosphatase family protein [Agromyces agglutinans]